MSHFWSNINNINKFYKPSSINNINGEWKVARVNWGLVLNRVDEALATFRQQGVKPTLRTLFYWLVSKQVIANVSSSYKSLSAQIVDARKEGRYAWDFLEDKTRVVLGSLADFRFSDSEIEFLESSLKGKLENLDVDRLIEDYFGWFEPSFTVDFWAEQPEVCEIWIEKEALASTIQSWTSDLYVPIRVNRGYSSWTFIYNNVQALASHLEKHQKVTIFYLGDLDPSGVDIQRFLEEAIRYFGLEKERVELVRLAVTPSQVEEFGLPPRPEDAETLAKLERDTRSKNYAYNYVVELDALVAFAPNEFRELIRKAIMDKWDKSIFEELKERAEELTEQAEEKLEEVSFWECLRAIKMSYRVKKLVVGKGRTVSHEQDGEWVREYFELEIEVPEESELAVAKENAEALLNEWLGIAEEKPKQKRNWNPEALKWAVCEGFKGAYERYPKEGEKAEAIQDYKNLLEDLKRHNGRLTREGYFYWLFQDNATIGRKKRG